MSDMQKIEGMPTCFSGIPESVELYSYPHHTFISPSSSYHKGKMLIGLRNGVLISSSFLLRFIEGRMMFDLTVKRSIQIGKLPVKLRPSSSSDTVYVMSDLLWLAGMDSSTDDNWPAINQVIFDSFQNVSLLHCC